MTVRKRGWGGSEDTCGNGEVQQCWRARRHVVVVVAAAGWLWAYGRDPRLHDRQAEPGERSREVGEETRAVRCGDADDGARVVGEVVEGDLQCRG